MKDDQKLVLALNSYRFGILMAAGLILSDDIVYEGGKFVRILPSMCPDKTPRSARFRQAAPSY